MRRLLRLMTRKRGHVDPVPDGRARLVTLTDYPWLDYSGDRAWCDAKLRPCGVCGGSCCACQHTERRPVVDGGESHG